MKTKFYPFYLLLFPIIISNIFSQGLPCEGFSDTTFPPLGWTEIFTGTNYWTRQPQSGFGLGSGSAMFDNYVAPNGTRQSLITPNFGAADIDSLFFDIAYCPWTSYPNDSLIILYSTNGGTNFLTLVRLGESQMGTTTNCTHPFVPSSSNWAIKKYLLPSGTNQIIFQAYSGFGDHLYLDSICANITYVGVKNKYQKIPLFYSLSQNYPNPFNPSTQISYSLPKPGIVKLIIYDILGEEIEVLFNDYQDAGNHSVFFNGDNLPSGVYIYKIYVNEFNDAKKMLLVR